MHQQAWALWKNGSMVKRRHVRFEINFAGLPRRGVTVLPTMPYSYAKPTSVAMIAETFEGRALDHLGLARDPLRRSGDA